MATAVKATTGSSRPVAGGRPLDGGRSGGGRGGRPGHRNTRHVARLAEGHTSSPDLEARPMEEIWAEFAETRCERIRNFLMEKFLHLVRFNAERIYARLPDEVDIEDLMSAGIFGLADAIEGFDLERKVKFETFSAPRIRGAILDELRSMDWVPRLVRHRSGRVDQARQSIEMETGRRASNDEIADRLQIDSEEFEKYMRDSHATSVTSINRAAFPSDGSRELREIDVIKDSAQINPVKELQRKDLKDLITRGLSRAERLIVVLYYYEGMTMKEIGLTLDLSESRVSQMHSSILARLKAQMQHRERELEPMSGH